MNVKSWYFAQLVAAVVFPLIIQTGWLAYRTTQDRFSISEWTVAISLVIGYSCVMRSSRRPFLLGAIYFPSMVLVSYWWLGAVLSRIYGIT